MRAKPAYLQLQVLQRLQGAWYTGETSGLEGDRKLREPFSEDAGSWPSLSDAAGMLSVHKATLSRQARRGNITARSLGFGHSRRVVSPLEVLRLGRVYQRVPAALLERRLAAYVAKRTHGDAVAIERRLSEMLDGGEAGGQASLQRVGRAEASNVPTWMAEFDRLLAASCGTSDDLSSVAAVTAGDTVYGGVYRDGDDVTLRALTGLDPATFQ
jgi:hypothetical protein